MSIEKILENIRNIENDWKCAIVNIDNPWSKHSKIVSWEIAWVSSLWQYLEEEFSYLEWKWMKISLAVWRSIDNDSDHLFLKNLEDKQNKWDLSSKRLFLFSPERVLYSTERLRHYTASDPKDFWRYIVLTNYNMHIELLKEIYSSKPWYELIESCWPCQMNSLHIKNALNSFSLSVVNIWIWPSNAKNITDHLAVLRPKLFIMIWHCWWLRNHQEIWDFVLADKFVTDCSILHRIQRSKHTLPIIPTFNLNIWLKHILEEKHVNFRLGTVFTTEDRNWELSYSEYKWYFDEDRSVAIDMESAIISAQWFKYKVPNATLLMISDKPLHWKLKKSGQSQKFYNDKKRIHLEVLEWFLNEIKENEKYYLSHNHLWSLLWAHDDTVLK